MDIEPSIIITTKEGCVKTVKEYIKEKDDEVKKIDILSVLKSSTKRRRQQIISRKGCDNNNEEEDNYIFTENQRKVIRSCVILQALGLKYFDLKSIDIILKVKFKIDLVDYNFSILLKEKFLTPFYKDGVNLFYINKERLLDSKIICSILHPNEYRYLLEEDIQDNNFINKNIINEIRTIYMKQNEWGREIELIKYLIKEEKMLETKDVKTAEEKILEFLQQKQEDGQKFKSIDVAESIGCSKSSAYSLIRVLSATKDSFLFAENGNRTSTILYKVLYCPTISQIQKAKKLAYRLRRYKFSMLYYKDMYLDQINDDIEPTPEAISEPTIVKKMIATSDSREDQRLEILCVAINSIVNPCLNWFRSTDDYRNTYRDVVRSIIPLFSSDLQMLETISNLSRLFSL